MAKFVSHDGVDAQGVRAEVMVQVGTGTIKEIVGRGTPAQDGTYRNVEVVFEPDNKLLKRKMYGLLDTSAAELWNLVQAAHADQRTVSYRIESQRMRGVDRTIPYGELNYTEQTRRILAGVDNVFSHEAKTNPKEDPSRDNPSALDQDVPARTVAAAGGSVSPESALRALGAARAAGLSETVLDTLMAHALAAGASLNDAMSAGFDADTAKNAAATRTSAAVASEERPWNHFNSDGRINLGSYAVTSAAKAEQFALDHLIRLYTPSTAKKPVAVSDEMIAQAAAAALEILKIADAVQAKTSGGRADRMKNSYLRALDLVCDAVDKRYDFPVGASSDAIDAWRTTVLGEAAERFYGIAEIAQGRLPKPEADRAAAEPIAVADTIVTDIPVDDEFIDESDFIDDEPAPAPAAPARPFHAGKYPNADDAAFEAPGEDLIARLKTLCGDAGITDNPKTISDWMEATLGQRIARKVHAPVLEAFLNHYEAAGAATVRAEATRATAA